MEMGTISKWLKNEGDHIQAGDVICQVETDKAVVDFEAQDEAYIAKILKGEGATDIPVGEAIFVTVEEQESVSAFQSFALSEAPVVPTAESPEPIKTPEPVAAAPTKKANVVPSDRVFASPLARKIARENGISLAGIEPSGPRGRILKEDVENALSSGTVSSTSVATTGSVSGSYADVQVADYARALADQLVEQKRQVPHYHLTCELNLDELLYLRKSLNGSKPEDQHVSVNDFLIRAAALALNQVPEVNSSWRGSTIRQYHNAHINVMMSVGNYAISPVIQNVNQRNITDISTTFRDLLNRTVDGALTSEDLSTGTFTMSNVGTYGVKSLSAIVSPGQACSLGLGAIQRVVVPDENKGFKTSSEMSATLACDHRVVDGAVGAQWLAAFKTLVEHPVQLLV